MNFPLNFIKRSDKYSTMTQSVPAPYFRKTFEVRNSPINKATLLICGLGFYEAHINGKNITKGYLAPYRSNLDDYIYYDKYEISHLLREGKNVLACVLGAGMINSVVDNWEFENMVWRGASIVSFSIDIEYTDGITETIISDNRTKTADSPIIFNDLHYGEYYDARLEIENWDGIDFDDYNWDDAITSQRPHGEPRICEADPIVSRGELKPITVTEFDGGYIYDFGINNAGVCRIEISGEKGQKILLQHFEKLVDGRPFFDNIKFAPHQRFQEDEYICSGNGIETHIPRFTYHGFRYVYVTGITKEQANDDLLTYILLSSDIKQIGNFECSNDVINKIQIATLRSDISNIHYFPTDCPQREKNGWTADASLSSEQFLLNYAPENSYKEWLKNIYKALDDNGQLPGIVPSTGWGYEWGNGPGWDSVLINLPYYMYIYRGDSSTFDELKAPLMRYLTNLYLRINEKGLIGYGLGDWCQPGTVHEWDYETPIEVTDSILSVDIAQKAATVFEVLKMDEQKQYALSLANRLRDAIRENLLDLDNSVTVCKTQTAQAMAIFYGMFDEDKVDDAVEQLVKMIETDNGFMNTGVLGARVIFRVLAENGYAELAFDMITRPEFPSYGYWMSKGATTLWEIFTLDERGKGSLNHHFWGDVSAWFYTYLAGIKINPNVNNVNEIHISPCFVNQLDFVKASHEHPCGKISVEWKRTDTVILLNIDCPEDVFGRIILRDNCRFSDGSNSKKLTKGNYRINQF